MELFHSTDADGRDGIEARGFAVSHVRDSAGQSWFSSTRGSTHLASGDGWFVIVDMPEEVAERHRYLFDDDGTPYLDNYRMPWAVVNGYQPFRFEATDA